MLAKHKGGAAAYLGVWAVGAVGLLSALQCED